MGTSICIPSDCCLSGLPVDHVSPHSHTRCRTSARFTHAARGALSFHTSLLVLCLKRRRVFWDLPEKEALREN